MKLLWLQLYYSFLAALTLPISTIAQNTATRFENFDTNKPVCKTLSSVTSALPSSAQAKIGSFCYTFVGTIFTQLGDYNEVTSVTGNVPLKTITVTGNAKKRRHRADPLEADLPAPTPALLRSTTLSTPDLASQVTEAPEYPLWELPTASLEYPYADVAAKAGVFPRQAAAAAAAPASTPSIFRSQASLAIRTGCACLGISVPVTIPLQPTRTVTSTQTVPISCARSPYSAYNFAGVGPASVASAPYFYGGLYFSPAAQVVPECCTFCATLSGCAYFIIKPAAGSPGDYDCEVYRFDDGYDYQPNPAQTGPGLPAVATDRANCPRGYVAVNSLTKKSLANGVVTGTYLGQCAVTTVRR